MSDQEANIPLDDELLSAYLDDELAPDERARVEERLASDPAARQTLDQLRAVSRAVQDLPRETIGEDLRQTILQRATLAAAKTSDTGAAPSTPRPTPDELAWPTPHLSIGRTMRGWVWAGLAVAAALLIMFLQPGGERDADVPGPVAMRSEHGRMDRDRSIELGGRGEASTMEAESAIASSERISGGGRGGAAAEPPAAPASRPPTLGTPLAASDAPTGGVEGRGRSAGEDNLAISAPTSGRDSITWGLREEVKRELEPTPNEPPVVGDGEQLVVVHVRVTPVAFQNKAFDGLLARNGIELEETPAVDELSEQAAEGRVLPESVSRRGQLLDAAEPQPQLDVVLVDAPAAQIASCLAELDKDTENYLAVDIEEEPTRSKSFSGKQSQVDQWKQYNRGRVPTQQKLMVSPRTLNETVEGGANAFGAGAYRGGAKGHFSAEGQQAEGYDKLGRARRVQLEPQTANQLAFGLQASESR